ncbi:MAG: hypothetical protein OEV55_10320 [candidate division Zixibacteria bacterium]|nr:hypothetical protein [candidate division Zixibacteria bacterium]
MLKKTFYIVVVLFLGFGLGYSEQGKVKIILENGYYYTQLETGEKFEIVKQNDWPYNTIVLSPDKEYVAYTTRNGLGFENEGRDIFYCKVDSSQRTFLHKFRMSVDTLLWESSDARNFIFVMPRFGEAGLGDIQIIDLVLKSVILSLPGDSLRKIQGTNCYEVYLGGKPIQKGKPRICLEELSSMTKPAISSVKFFTSWVESDIYISTQREPVLKISDLPELAEKFGKKFGELVKNNYFYISVVVFSAQYNTIAIIGAGGRSFGLFDLGEKKLLLFDYSDSLVYANPTWSPDGSRLALLKKSGSVKNIDFYELKGEGKINLVKTYELIAGIPVSVFRWSDDSDTFYFSYLNSNNQWSEEQIDLSR